LGAGSGVIENTFGVTVFDNSAMLVTDPRFVVAKLAEEPDPRFFMNPYI